MGTSPCEEEGVADEEVSGSDQQGSELPMIVRKREPPRGSRLECTQSDWS